MPNDTTEAPSVAEALATIRGDAVATEPDPTLELAPLEMPAPPEEPVAAEELGPYVARLMGEARHAAEEYRRETEREVAERAAAVYAQATADANQVRAQAKLDAEATIAAARTRVEALVARVSAMADELKTEAQALLAPEPEPTAPGEPLP